MPTTRKLREDAEQGPSARHWMGVDPLARDLMSRVLYGARVSLDVAVTATAVSVLIGVVAGALAGYFGKWTDEALMRTADVFSAFPGILLAVAITAAFRRPSLAVVFVALGLVGWSGVARIVRGQVLTLREEEFVTAAAALGAGRLRILFRHILPNCLAPVIVTATLLVAGNILGEAGLSFLGIGVQPPHPSWGGMLAEARQEHDALLVDVRVPRRRHRADRAGVQPPRRRPARRARPQGRVIAQALGGSEWLATSVIR